MKTLTLSLALISALLCANAAHASGTYSDNYQPPPEKFPDDDRASKVNHKKYELGKKIFVGSAKLEGGGTAEYQLARLKIAQLQLPAKTAKTKDLPALAGKLSVAQLDALEYYVDQRYPKKK